jgi:nucleoside-diphosphate-sugar epimerase
MKLAIFGGSGVVGRELLPVLLAGGHRIRAMRHRAPLPVEGIEVVEGGLSDPSAVAATIEGAEAVLQLTKGGDGVEQAVETSVRGTINILDAIRKTPSVRQHLLTSSDAATGICSHPHAAPISHRTPPMTYPGYYSLGKVLEEVIVHEYDRNGGVPFTIARLSYVHQEDSALRLFVAGEPGRAGRGPWEDHYSPQLRQRLDSGESFVVLPTGDDDQPLGRTLVQREDVVDALAAMVGRPAAIGQTFHVSGPGFRYDLPCRHLTEKLGLPIERVLVEGMHSFTIDYSHTSELLGWSPRFDVIAMLDAAIAWREAQGKRAGEVG